MRKYKEDIKTILEVLGFIAYMIIIGLAVDTALGSLIFIPVLCLLAYSIYNKIRYIRIKDLSEIRFPMENGEYGKYSSITLGSVFLAGSLVWFYFMTEFTYAPVFLLVFAMLVLINGILVLPSGELKVEESRIKLPNIRNIIYLEEVISIHINQTNLIINKDQIDPLKLEKLNLDEHWTLRITEFLQSHLSGNEVEIKTWMNV